MLDGEGLDYFLTRNHVEFGYTSNSIIAMGLGGEGFDFIDC